MVYKTPFIKNIYFVATLNHIENLHEVYRWRLKSEDLCSYTWSDIRNDVVVRTFNLSSTNSDSTPFIRVNISEFLLRVLK